MRSGESVTIEIDQTQFAVSNPPIWGASRGTVTSQARDLAIATWLGCDRFWFNNQRNVRAIVLIMTQNGLRWLDLRPSER